MIKNPITFEIRETTQQLPALSGKIQKGDAMKKVKGIGGIFFKSNHSEELVTWYKEKLGVPVTPDGCGVFQWKDAETPHQDNYTVWAVMPADTDYWGKSKSDHMINYIVDSIDEFVEQLKENGVEMDGGIQEYPQGRFAWGYDPDGNRFELWEPNKEQS